MSKIRKIEKKLLEAALKARKNAYVLWGFRVGAAVHAEDEQIYSGCNIESWISGLGVCAERCATDHAVLHGNKKIKEIAIVTDVDAQHGPRPCGACLQYISSFAETPEIKIIMAKAEKGTVMFETIEVKTLRELLPYPFRK